MAARLICFAQTLVWAACAFKEAWVYSNAKQGISDHGHRREMSDRTAQYVVKAACSMLGREWSEELIETVRSRMDKASERRNLPNSVHGRLHRNYCPGA